MGSKDKWNSRNYDCVSIRFPKGTKSKFKKTFPGVSFNSFVVDSVLSELLIANNYGYGESDYCEFVNNDFLNHKDLL